MVDDVLNDPRSIDKAWARNQGIVASAGHPLLVRESLVGVRRFFRGVRSRPKRKTRSPRSRMPLPQGIAQKQTEEAWQSTRAELARVTHLTAMAALSASIAHEVTEPLAAIVTNGDACLRLLASDVAESGRDPESGGQHHSGCGAAEVVARVRGLLKRSDVDQTPLDLGQVIRDVLFLVQPEVARHRIVLRTSLADDLPPVRGDRIQLQQVILNLLTNAIQAMSDVADRSRELMVSAYRHEVGEGAGVRVVVEDTGVGFEQADVERLFQALYTTKRDGLGMGQCFSSSCPRGEVRAHERR